VSDNLFVRKPGGRRLWYAAALLALLTVVAVWLWRTPGRGGADNVGEGLDGYVPADCCGVLTFNVRALLEAPGAARLPGGAGKLLRLGAPALQPRLELVGLDLERDVEWVQLFYLKKNLPQPLILLRGRIDATRFRTGPKELEKQTGGPGGRYVLYRHRDPEAGEVFLAPAGPYLLVSLSRERVLGGLEQGAHPRPLALEDERMKRLLDAVDRKQHLWLAVRIDQLGYVSRLENTGLELALRPLLNRAQSAGGGLRCGDDLRAQFDFRARDEEEARALRQALEAACASAKLLLGLNPPADEGHRLLMDLVATGKVSQEDRDVRLRCRLPLGE
jgi:hypothetical protein